VVGGEEEEEKQGRSKYLLESAGRELQLVLEIASSSADHG